METRQVLGMRVDATSYEHALSTIVSWAEAGTHRYVCAANVHMTMVAVDDPSFRAVVNGADLVTPDGMPLVWMLRLLGVRRPSRVRGPTIMRVVCEALQQRGISVGLYGGDEDLLSRAVAELHRKLPRLDVGYSHAPPFRPLSAEEDARVVADIKASGIGVLFVGLGCPKQERWMQSHVAELPVVQIGVGAAFALLAGRTSEAPGWMQAMGLEWTFRLIREPRRLWRRYLLLNPRFVALALLQLLGLKWSQT